jgi:hypothetical protein
MIKLIWILLHLNPEYNPEYGPNSLKKVPPECCFCSKDKGEASRSLNTSSLPNTSIITLYSSEYGIDQRGRSDSGSASGFAIALPRP